MLRLCVARTEVEGESSYLIVKFTGQCFLNFESLMEFAGDSGLAPVAHLARTYKLFRDPALDILWRELDDFSPLIKCMPTTVWEEKEIFYQETEAREITLVSSL